MLGWRAAAFRLINSEKVDRQRRKEGIKRLNRDDAGDTTRTLVTQAERFPVHRLRAGELVDFDAYRRSEHYDYDYRELGISDRL